MRHTQSATARIYRRRLAARRWQRFESAMAVVATAGAALAVALALATNAAYVNGFHGF